MEEQIKRIVRRQKWLYALLWLGSVVLIVAGEIGVGDWQGMFAADTARIYYGETLVILLTATCVPVSLKLFAWVMTKKIEPVTISKALYLYAVWSNVRLALLALPLYSGLLLYYLMMSNKCVLCAAIALIASLFCVPGEERLRRELNIDRDKE
ncbi:MAG: hypothetical protein LBN06_02815 [Prevotellaceae bacterium]|jgi:hypothetical protein|nr:hypothetical protein [Prevotellaceae bacterium]